MAREKGAGNGRWGRRSTQLLIGEGSRGGAEIVLLRQTLATLAASEDILRMRSQERWPAIRSRERSERLAKDGGEGGIRTRSAPVESATYRTHVADSAMNPGAAVAHCPPLPGVNHGHCCSPCETTDAVVKPASPLGVAGSGKWRRRPDLNRGWRFCRFRRIGYVVDSSCFLVSARPRFSPVFGQFATQVGPRFLRARATFKASHSVT